MPIQVWTPTLQPRDNSALAAAISGAGKSIGNALAGIADEHKRTNTQAKAVESFLSAMSDEERAKMGVTDMFEFKNRPAKAKVAFALGQDIAREHQQHQQRSAVFGANLRDINDRIEARKAEALNMQRSPKFLSALSRYQQPSLEALPPGVEGPANLQPGLDFSAAAGRAAEETGFQLPTSALARLLDEMGSGESEPFFKTDQIGKGLPVMSPSGPIPGTYQVPLGPKSSQIVTDPTLPQRPAAERANRVRVVTDEFGESKIIQEFTPEEFKQQFPGRKVPQPEGSSPGNPPSISTQEEYNALKSGDVYVDAASGKTKRKK